jgi:hypothetical protein
MAYRTMLLLVELKVVEFHSKFVQQVLKYRDDLLSFQESGRLLRGEIQPYLLCTSASRTQKEIALSDGIICLDYDPEQVLQYFYTNLRPIAHLAKLKPIDIGIWNLHLLHDFIYLLKQTSSVAKLRQLVSGSQRTLYNKIKFAKELRLIEWLPNQDTISLTALGREYVKCRDEILPERLSDAQIELLRRFLSIRWNF